MRETSASKNQGVFEFPLVTVSGRRPNEPDFGHAVVMTELEFGTDEIKFTLKNSLKGEHLIGTQEVGKDRIKLTNKGENKSGTKWTTGSTWPIYFVKFE